MRTHSLFKTMALAALAICAVCAFASAAQAKSWHVESVPLGTLKEQLKTTHKIGAFTGDTASGGFNLGVKGRNMEAKCSATASGEAYGSVGLSATVTLSKCKLYYYESSTLIPNCVVSEPLTISLEGTGESLAAVGSPTMIITGCSLPEKSVLGSIALTNSWGPETQNVSVASTGTGKFGGFAMTVAGTFTWALTDELVKYRQWGFENDHNWYLGGSLLTGSTTFQSTGTLTVEIPYYEKRVTCNESGTGTIGSGLANSSNQTLSKCIYEVQGIKQACEPILSGYPLTGEGTGAYSSQEKIVLQGNGCAGWQPEEKLAIGFLSRVFGPESTKLSVSTSGTSVYGGRFMYFSGSSTWQATGTGSGKTLGFH